MTAPSDQSPFVVSFDWLRDRIGQPDLKIVDASWYLPAQNRHGEAEYRAGRIPGAVYFDLDRIVDPEFQPASHAPRRGDLRHRRGRSRPQGNRHDRGL